MRIVLTKVATVVSVAAVLSAPSLGLAQVVQTPSAPPAVDCVPAANTNPGAPRGDRPSGETMSDKLAKSKGVICPPGGMDSEIRVTPPDGGRMRVIPPPVEPQPPK
jgi:hypothetical protein